VECWKEGDSRVAMGVGEEGGRKIIVENSLLPPASSKCTSPTDNNSTPSSTSRIRMYMYPLYVLEVRETWPENGRARKAVDIDTAIEMVSERPEFQRVLLEIKEKGYHLTPGKYVDTEGFEVG